MENNQDIKSEEVNKEVKKEVEVRVGNTTPEVPVSAEDGSVNISKQEWEKVQEQLKMLESVADKGRVFNYENQKAATGKKVKKIKLSVWNGKFVIGWATIKDILVKHPTTGMTVGEEQQYELLLLAPDGTISKLKVDGYVRFSDIRYTERAECTIIGQSEDYDGKITFDVQLPDGRVIKLSDRFIN